MAPTTEPPPVGDHAVGAETTLSGLTVHGTLPAALSGQLVGIGLGPGSEDGVVHSIDLHAGRIASYRSRWVITDAVARRLGTEMRPGPPSTGRDIVASNIIAFGGSILALGDGSLAYELTSDLDTLRRVDLAGQSSGLAPFPKRDPVTGDLHVLAITSTGSQAHVVVSAGALTRHSRPVAGAPVTDLAITRDRVVFAADGFIGVFARDRDAHSTWIATGVGAPVLVHAHDVGDTVVALVVTPSLERWTLHAASATVHREVLDPTPRCSARTADHPLDQEPRFLWTTGGMTADKHDLITTGSVCHVFGPDRMADGLAFVADAARPSDADGGWLVGFVHHTSRNQTDIVVLDAADIARPAIATVHIPRRIPRGLHSTWIASTHQ